MVRTGHHFNVAPTAHDDDRFIGLSDSAIALWMMAGSYCVDHITDPGPTDGRVSRARAQRLRPGTFDKAAAELVDAGLWKKSRGRNSGWQFTEWAAEQQTKTERETYLDAEKARKRKPQTAPKDPNKKENPRSDAEPSARKAGRNPAGTPDGSSAEAPADPQRREVRDTDRERNTDVDGRLSAHDQTRPRAKPVDNSVAAEWRDDRCTDHQTASDAAAGECQGCSRSRVVVERASIRAQAEARRAEAAERKRLAVEAARNCSRCRGTGYVGSARCTHRDPGGRARAEAALRAQAASAARGADAPSNDEEQPSTPAGGLARVSTSPDRKTIHVANPYEATVQAARVQRHLAREIPTMPPVNLFIPGAAQ